MIGPILIALAIILLIVAALVFIRAQQFGETIEIRATVELPEVDSQKLAEHLADVIRCETVSNQDWSRVDTSAFDALHAALEKNYPLLHKTLKKEVFAGHNLIYRWEGKHPDMDPILFMAHQDVVPADPATLDQWTHAPFSGEIADGIIWGRGALDTKNQIIAVMDAIEHLLAQSFQPERSIYLAFGQDEEIGGDNGQRLISERFKQEGIHFAAVIDEGGSISSGLIPGVEIPIALVGNAEKGFVTLELKSTGDGGHSAMPPKETTIGRLAAALARLEASPVPSIVDRVVPMFESMGKALPFNLRLAFANQWLFGTSLRKKLESDKRLAASIRTTTAITVINGGVKDNVLPSEATALVNFRLAPGDTIASLIEYVNYIIDDEHIQVTIKGDHPWEASPVSNVESPAFDRLKTCVQEVYGNVAVVPFLMLGATDARYYSELSENVYRFGPLAITPDEMSGVHNVNEHISVAGFTKMAQSFILIIQSWSAASWVDQA